ncbi:MAG: amidohydrolase family protein [Candidatus Daviesbacteria bacterium]|nr:amidohydrolase family protein [Candidatus Daviesbacteria bacterium]
MLDLKQIILEKIKKNGGWVNCHSHIDRAYTIDEKLYKLANKLRHEKWILNTDLRKTSTTDQIYDRMARALELMIAQGVTAIGSFIDIDPHMKDKAIQAATKIREKYKSQIIIKFISHSSYGILTKETRQWFETGADFADIIGGMVKANQDRQDEYFDIILQTAKAKKKMTHIHVDEENTLSEKETELLAKKTIEHGRQGQVVGIHGISINCHPKPYRQEVYQLMKKAGVMMIACPISWLNSRRSEQLTPTHNPTTPVDEMITAGITVGIGTDNIADLFMPYNDGDMWGDLRVMMEMNRLYDIDTLVKIATTNGKKILGID